MLSNFIKKIIVPPKCKDSFVESIRDMVSKYGLSKYLVERSILDRLTPNEFPEFTLTLDAKTYLETKGQEAKPK